MSRKLMLALAILAVTTTPALARGGGGFTVGSAAAGSVVSSALAVSASSALPSTIRTPTTATPIRIRFTARRQSWSNHQWSISSSLPSSVR